MSTPESSVKPTQKFLENALFIVDASSYIFRAYYGLQTNLTAPDGTPTHATYAFVGMIRSLTSQFKSQKIILVWDRKEPTFRVNLYKEYKANRSAPPEDLSLQIENTLKVMELWGYPQISVPGFEADDIIATLVKQRTEPTVIVTADKDLLQLVSERTWCLDTKKNFWANAEAAFEKFGVSPDKISDVQAIMGDSSDNIPGAPGIGPKGAAELIQHFGSLEKIFATALERKDALDTKYKDPLNGKKLKSIVENIPLVEISKKLVVLADNVPLPALHFERQGFQHDELIKELERLGFRKYVTEVEGLMGGDASPKKSEAVSTAETTSKATQIELIKSEKIYKTLTNISELNTLLEKAQKKEYIAFDTETFSLERVHAENMVGFSLSLGGGDSYYAPLRHQSGDNLNPGLAIDSLSKFFQAKPKCIYHNAKFDWHQLANEDSYFDHPYEDTLLASFLLDVTGSHNLENLAERYLNAQTTRFDEVVKKGENFSHVDIARATHYAAEDAELTYQLWQLFEKQLKEKNLYKIYDLMDRPLSRVLYKMERVGVSIDSTYLHHLYRELERERFKFEEEARDLLKSENVAEFETINLGSPKQLAKVLFQDLKLPVIKTGKTGPSTDFEVLEELSYQHKFPKLLLELRELSKLISTYVEPLPQLVNPATKKLHTQFSQTIAQTGRLASSDPNLQNIPIRTERGGRIRNAFVAEKGYKLYSADYSQIELRFLAEFSKDPELLRAFTDGADIHSRTAALVFEKKEAEVTADERRSAKAINFGIIYGQSAFGLAKSLGISRGDAARFIENYFKSYPQLKIWMESVVEEAKKTGNVLTLCGRNRVLENIHSKNPALRNFAERIAVNSPLQGTAADLIKVAMIRVQNWIDESGAPVKMVLQIHDELLFEVKDGFEKEFHQKLKDIIEDKNIFSQFGVPPMTIPLITDHGIGINWGELEEL